MASEILAVIKCLLWQCNCSSVGNSHGGHLAKGQWPHLKWLSLSNCAYIQGSLKRVANTSPKQTGKNSNNSTFVTFD